MKKLKLIVFFIFVSLHSNALSETKVPFKKENVKKIYQLENGNKIYIEQFERGDKIWEKDKSSNEFRNIAFVWSFIDLAKSCEGINERDIYFANNLEYYLGGGTKIDNPQIRIVSLKDPSPWRDSDLGIVPNIKWAKQFCVFY